MKKKTKSAIGLPPGTHARHPKPERELKRKMNHTRHSTNPKKVALRIKRISRKLKLTCGALAKALGVSKRSVIRWRTATYAPLLSTQRKLIDMERKYGLRK